MMEGKSAICLHPAQPPMWCKQELLRCMANFQAQMFTAAPRRIGKLPDIRKLAFALEFGFLCSPYLNSELLSGFVGVHFTAWVASRPMDLVTAGE